MLPGCALPFVAGVPTAWLQGNERIADANPHGAVVRDTNDARMLSMMLRPENDMPESPSIPREELTHWLEAVRDLPDVRTQKVRRARHAIQHHTYDNEEVVDETIERLCLDLETAVGDAQ